MQRLGTASKASDRRRVTLIFVRRSEMHKGLRVTLSVPAQRNAAARQKPLQPPTHTTDIFCSQHRSSTTTAASRNDQVLLW
jgi:hypothetical protein